MKDLNLHIIRGNIASDPKFVTLNSGGKKASFSVGTSISWRDRATSEWKSRSTFHNVVVWGSDAEDVGQNGRKGDRVTVEGRVETREYTDNDGNRHFITETVCNSCMLGKKAATAPRQPDAEAARPAAAPQGQPPAQHEERPPARSQDTPPPAMMDDEMDADIPF